MMKPRTILVVDDEQDILDLVSYNLKRDGYTVHTQMSGDAALADIRRNRYDLIVLDVMMPGLQGFELCRILRSDTATRGIPVIMLTARGEEVDRVLGLEMGADDYVTKPFSPRELLARVHAVLRRIRTETRSEERVLHVGDLVIDRDSFTVLKKGTAIELSSIEFKLLLYLAERKRKIFSRDQLLDAAWNNEAFVEPRTVDVHIRRLRTQIEDDPSNPVYIKTRRGVGYYMEAEI